MAYQKLRTIKGIGEKTEKLFEKLGVFSVQDLIHYYPRDYDMFEEPVSPAEAAAGKKNAVLARVTKQPSVRTFGRNSITMLQVYDGEHVLQINWFHMPYLRSQLKPGMWKVFRGAVIEKQNRLIMEHPQIFDPGVYEGLRGQMLPVYALTAGLSNQTVQKTVKACLDLPRESEEYMPEAIRSAYSLGGLDESLETIHFPPSYDSLIHARRRLVFDDFFLFLAGVALLKKQLGSDNESYRMKAVWKTEEVIESLPYRLTDGQMDVWHEIERDLGSGHAMSRLVQGDVGSGKTILAFLAMILTAKNGFQSALMVPTEVLAHQHYDALRQLLEQNQMDAEQAVLLTGSCTAKEKSLLHERIASGSARLIIGTHALIQEAVDYRDLALVITDEQHRFGVRQRGVFSEKGTRPHVLVMSATPIPRTLAMILYGDLDISALHELPARRAKIKNAVVDTSYRPAAYHFFKKEIEKGHQVYVICPMVEPNEEIPAENVTEYAAMLQKEMGGDIRVEALHGRMRPSEKNEIMQAFADNRIQILVSTTVIEVGINVPNATVMMVENAERFGLAQLHQLRGRVGRGEAQSYCIFVQGDKGKEPAERLKILQKTNDGFQIAEEDLRLRGPGDLFGVRQSGIAVLTIADIYRDQDVLKIAYEAVQKCLHNDPELILPENSLLKQRIDYYMRHQNDDISM